MKKYKIPYGEKMLDLEIPENIEVFYADLPCVTCPEDPYQEINRALDNPIGTERIEKIVKPKDRICIICDDITRPTPVRKILEVLLQRLMNAGVAKENIFIVIALGSHRYMTEEEKIERMGMEIYRNFRVLNSEFKDPDGLFDMGYSKTGAKIYVSRSVMDSDIRIGIGNIVPHPAMGWSGGGKILYPGVTDEVTVTQFHIQQGFANENLFGMDDCFIRLEVEQWVDTIGLHFIVNTVLTPDKKLYRAVSGHYVKAQRAGVEFAKQVLGTKLEKPCEIVVVSSYPADLDYWQATKGYLCGAHGAVGNGTIILVTPCNEGIGPHPEYADCIGNDEAENLLIDMLNGKAVEGDPLALCIGTCVSKIRQKYDLVTVSDGLGPDEMKRAAIKYYPVEKLSRAISDAIAMYENPSVLIIPNGGETVLYKSD
ncbi:MAG: nickel-dependent lactate racemase [Clostridiaceae bacterium]|nr:nickel-dependent lactate racemase [Clostridiaceae bacterium]